MHWTRAARSWYALAKRAAIRSALLPVVCALVLPAPAAAETRTFQQGFGGYEGTEDLHLTIPEDFTGEGHKEGESLTNPEAPRFEWDHTDTWGEGSIGKRSGAQSRGFADIVGLLRFRDLFGADPNQIPPGAAITSATLSLRGDSVGFPANLFRVLVDWDESTVWNDFGPAPGIDFGLDISTEIEVTTPPIGAYFAPIDVTASLQAWSSAPASNRGWLFMAVEAQDVITVSGSALGPLTKVTLDLEMTSSQHGELIVWVRRGDYVALLLRSLGREDCDGVGGSLANDVNVTFDDDAAEDIHFSNAVGTFRPDAFCESRPLCSSGGSNSLCAQSADGQWVLRMADQWRVASSRGP